MNKVYTFCFFILCRVVYAQWSSTAPTVICNASGFQDNVTMIADGTGGYIMAWMDHRGGSLPNDPTFSNIYIQRLNADGVPQWTANGLLVCGAPNEQNYPLLALCKTSTNQPRIMVVWRDGREIISNNTRTKIYAQSYDFSGNAQWAANGVQVADCNGFTSFIHDIIPSSDGNRVLFAWTKDPSDFLYVQAINPDNGSTLYAGDGTLIDSNIFQGDRVKLGQAEGSTDIHVVWNNTKTESGTSSYNIYAQRVNTATGDKQWTNPTKVCIAARTQDQVQIQGNIVVWRDERLYVVGGNSNRGDIYAQRLNADGTVAWPVNGINITNDPGYQFWPCIAPAGTNSVWVTWTDETISSKDSSHVSIQKINSDGTLAFGNQGIKLASNYNSQAQGMVVSQDDGGALVLYQAFGPTGYQYRAHKISATGQKLWGPLGQPVSGFTQASTSDPYTIEGIPLAGGGAVFALDPQDIWAMRAKICDTPPAVPSIVSPYRRCNPGSYNINLVSSGCPAGFVRYFSAPDGLRLLTSTNPANSNPNQTTLSSRDTTQYVYAECVVNGCASTGALTPAHIQIAETVYTDVELSAVYPKVTGELPTLALSRTTITAQNRINAPANVTYEATQSVTLNPGFQTNQGAVFRAEVKACMNLN